MYDQVVVARLPVAAKLYRYHVGLYISLVVIRICYRYAYDILYYTIYNDLIHRVVGKKVEAEAKYVWLREALVAGVKAVESERELVINISIGIMQTAL
jgi:hypothetical protein